MRPRSRLRRARTTAVALHLVALGGCAQKPTVYHAATPNATGDTSAALVDDLQDLGRFGFAGAVLVRQAADVLVRVGVGQARPNGPAIDASTLFDIGSLAKQFTAAAVLALTADGKLTLTDTVGHFLPEAPAPVATIRLDQLLTHTSGLPRGNLTGRDRSELTPTTRDSAVARALRSRPQFPPGSKMAYSNAGYILLAAIIEQASGLPYNEYLRRRLFARAGLRDTRFWGERGSAIAAAGRDELGVVFDPNDAPMDNWAIRGAGGILSSLADLDRWMSALSAGLVLPPELVTRMMSSHGSGYGFGWFVGQPNTRYASAAYHGGDYHGFGSQLIWYPAMRRLIVILTSVRHEADEYPTRIAVENAVFAGLDGAARATPRVAGPAAADHLIGRYRSDDGASFEIARGAFGLEVGALNQAAVDRMWHPAPDTAAYWKALDDRAEAVLLGALRRDSAAVRRALAATDDPPYVYEQLTQELAAELAVSRDNPDATRVRALGTYPAVPRGSQWTIAEIMTTAGVSYYRLRWDPHGNVGSYHRRSPRLASAWPLASGDTSLVAWDLVHRIAPIMLDTSGGLRLTGSSETIALKPVR